MALLNLKHRALLILSAMVILVEMAYLIVYRELALDWLSHNLWVVLIPFTKVIVKKVITMKLLAFIKLALSLSWHLGKLLILKILKTLGLRYGVYFSQARWRWIRYAKVMFLRKGKLFFRALKNFWQAYSRWQQWLILVAFFPVVILLFLAGLSFNITRKTMVQRVKESAMFEAAASATTRTSSIKARLQRLDSWALEKIEAMNAGARAAAKQLANKRTSDQSASDHLR